MKAIETFFIVCVVLWGFWTISASGTSERSRRFCAPVTAGTSLIGAITRGFDESAGESIRTAGATTIDRVCRIDFAPYILGVIGAAGQDPAATLPNEAEVTPGPAKPADADKL